MTKPKRSEYIRMSRILVRKLKHSGRFGEGSIYFDNLYKGMKDEKDKVLIVLEGLVKQRIAMKKKKQHGWKYYLNTEKRAKIDQICKESGKITIVSIIF